MDLAKHAGHMLEPHTTARETSQSSLLFPTVLGAQVGPDGTLFTTYASASECSVRLFGADGRVLATHPMDRVARDEDDGVYFQVHLPRIGPGALYKWVLGERELPDPYARFLPDGVMGPAMVVSSSYDWKHPLPGTPLDAYVIYELHVGTFSPEGTFAGARRLLPELAELGVTAIELMPIAAFAGSRGWGYDGVALFAPFNGYGTPDDLRALVDAAHQLGISVLLDVVYNHFGPAGNFLREFSHNYFTKTARNAWGDAPNYAHPAMRRLVIDNALYWLEELRFDGLRLDAIHTIDDPSEEHVLHELARSAAALYPARVLIGEDERNDPRCVTDLGLHGVWADDFHHAVHVNLTGEREGYYAAYAPSVDTIAETIDHGWYYRGQLNPATSRARGLPASYLDAQSFVYCIQNHDQIGNRALGERLNHLVSLQQYKAASTLLMFLPMTPLLFMGQEWGASTPFLYFTDHEHELGMAIVEGRRNEFKDFAAFTHPESRERIPNPQNASTYERCRLVWAERKEAEPAEVLALYKQLIQLRAADPVLRTRSRTGLSARALGAVLVVTRVHRAEARLLVVNFGDQPAVLNTLLPKAGGRLLLSSDGSTTAGDVLRPATAAIFESEGDYVGDYFAS